MESIHRSRARWRLAEVVDMANAAQVDSKGLNMHIKTLREMAGENTKGSLEQFLSDTGGGI